MRAWKKTSTESTDARAIAPVLMSGLITRDNATSVFFSVPSLLQSVIPFLQYQGYLVRFLSGKYLACKCDINAVRLYSSIVTQALAA